MPRQRRQRRPTIIDLLLSPVRGGLPGDKHYHGPGGDGEMFKSWNDPAGDIGAGIIAFFTFCFWFAALVWAVVIIYFYF